MEGVQRERRRERRRERDRQCERERVTGRTTDHIGLIRKKCCDTHSSARRERVRERETEREREREREDFSQNKTNRFHFPLIRGYWLSRRSPLV